MHLGLASAAVTGPVKAMSTVDSGMLSKASRLRHSSHEPRIDRNVVDSRHLAGLLRGEPEVGGTGTLPCGGYSLPLGAWEPGDRGSAPGALGPWGPKSPLVSARTSTQQQLDALAERIGGAVAGLQRQCDTEKRAVERRLQQMEREMKSAIGRMEGDHARESDWREKLAMLPGCISGLAEESQALARRVDGLDERLWARTSGAEEIARQAAREMAQQLQAFERQARLAGAASEEAQKRQATRQRRVEHMLEDFSWRLAKTEEQREQRSPVPEMSGPRGMEVHLQGVELRLQELDKQVGTIGKRLQAMEEQLNNRDDVKVDEATSRGMCDAVTEESREHRAALEAVERETAAQRSQMEEISKVVASLRVKVDGQAERHRVMTDRLETAHLPAMEALKNDIAEARARDLSEFQSRVAELDKRLSLTLEANDSDAIAEQIEKLRHRVSGSEAIASDVRREVNDLRAAHRSVMERSSRTRGAGVDVRGDALTGPTIQEQLGAVADQLEAIDDFAARLTDVQDRVSGLEQREHERALQPRGADVLPRADSPEQLAPLAPLRGNTSAADDASIAEATSERFPSRDLGRRLSAGSSIASREPPQSAGSAIDQSLSRDRGRKLSAGSSIGSQEPLQSAGSAIDQSLSAGVDSARSQSAGSRRSSEQSFHSSDRSRLRTTVNSSREGPLSAGGATERPLSAGVGRIRPQSPGERGEASSWIQQGSVWRRSESPNSVDSHPGSARGQFGDSSRPPALSLPSGDAEVRSSPKGPLTPLAPVDAEVRSSPKGPLTPLASLAPIASSIATSPQLLTPPTSATLAPLGPLKSSLRPLQSEPSPAQSASLSTATPATSLRAPPEPSRSNSLVPTHSASSLPRVSHSPSPQLSRKQSLDSSFSCDVLPGGDELVSDEEELQERCDITVDVITPTGQSPVAARGASEAPRMARDARPSLLAEVEASGSEGFEHEVFEDDDIPSFDGSNGYSVAESESVDGGF